MSCVLYSGTPGSGKSLHAAQKITMAMRGGKNVIANFPINMDYFRSKKGKMPRRLGNFYYVRNQDLTVSFLKKFSKEHLKHFRESQALVVIDECSVLFNPRIDRKDRMDWITFFSQHRKYGYDIILISQSDCLIDRQIRPMIETEEKHRSMKNYGIWGWLFTEIFCNFFWVNSYWYGCKMKLSSNVFCFHKKQASLYNTYKIFDEEEESDNGKGKASVLQHIEAYCYRFPRSPVILSDCYRLGL